MSESRTVTAHEIFNTNIMNDNIIPLLYEYFYDNKKNVNKAIEDTMGKVDYTVVDNKTGRIFVIEKE